MEHYDENLSVQEGLAELFRRFGFKDDAYTAKWFAIMIGKFPVYVPNIPSRRIVARYHDIHHVLTGYPANWKGEAEIGAWEIATGCREHFVAWFLNGGAMLVGLVLWPRAVRKAWQRGRRTKTNLYHDFDYDSLLPLKIKDLRGKIGLAEA